MEEYEQDEYRQQLIEQVLGELRLNGWPPRVPSSRYAELYSHAFVPMNGYQMRSREHVRPRLERLDAQNLRAAVGAVRTWEHGPQKGRWPRS